MYIVPDKSFCQFLTKVFVPSIGKLIINLRRTGYVCHILDILDILNVLDIGYWIWNIEYWILDIEY